MHGVANLEDSIVILELTGDSLANLRKGSVSIQISGHKAGLGTKSTESLYT